MLALATWSAFTTPAGETQGSVDLLRVELADEVMGTTFDVVVYGRDPAALQAAGRAALAEASRLDALLSNYKPDSEWSAMNRTAASRPFTASPELFALLEASAAYSRASDGAFDISVGPLMTVWGFFRGEGALPSGPEIAAGLARVGHGHVILDSAARSVRFARPGVELDPGGIGKGYAIDRMADLLRSRGVTRAWISAGGSTIYGLGRPPDDPRGWPVTIRSPRNPRLAAAVFLDDLSLSTSGSDAKFFRAGGRTYAHIMDPRTGYPASGTSLVSVLAPRAIDSEAWTTAYFVQGREWTSRHLPPGMKALMCDDAEQASCGWVE